MHHRRHLAGTAVTVLAVGLALGVSATPAAADPVGSIGEIQASLDGCAGAVTVTLTADISAPGTRIGVPDDCEATLDLAGFDLDVEGIDIGDGGDDLPGPDAQLTITDLADANPSNDGTLTAESPNSSLKAGIRTTDAVLIVEAGVVESTGGDGGAGIGGDDGDDNDVGGCEAEDVDGGTVIVNGGSVTAIGRDPIPQFSGRGAGIGGGECGEGGTVTINGGTVTARGGGFAAGIGGGDGLLDADKGGQGGTTTITAGTVDATGGLGGAGIGGGGDGAGGTISISGGTVTATSRFRGAGIGGGDHGDGGTITIDDGTVTAEGGGQRGEWAGAGIGGGGGNGFAGDGGTVEINGGTVKATGGVGLATTAAGIGGGTTFYDEGIGGDGGNVTITGGQVTASSGDGAVPFASGAGIGGGGGAIGGVDPGSNRAGHGGAVTISGGEVAATSDGAGAGIGGGGAGSVGGDGGSVTVTGGTVSASGGSVSSSESEYSGAGIGGGGDIGAGILSGDGGAGGSVEIGADATVTALGGHTAVGSAASNATFGSLMVAGTLIVPEDSGKSDRFLRIPDSTTDGAEVTVSETGQIVGDDSVDDVPDDGAQITGDVLEQDSEAGQIVNHGAITLATSLVTGAATTPITDVSDRHHEVTFDANGGTLAGGTTHSITVFAPSFTAGERPFPADPTPPAGSGATFTGWNTSPDGSGQEIDADDELPGSSADGSPVEVTLFAQFADENAPTVTDVRADPDPVIVGEDLAVFATAADDSGVASAAYSLNPTGAMNAVDGAFGGTTEALTTTIDTTGIDAGDHELCVTATDTAGNTGEAACTTVTLAAAPDDPGEPGDDDDDDSSGGSDDNDSDDHDGSLPNAGVDAGTQMLGVLGLPLFAGGIALILATRRHAGGDGRHVLTEVGTGP